MPKDVVKMCGLTEEEEEGLNMNNKAKKMHDLFLSIIFRVRESGFK